MWLLTHDGYPPDDETLPNGDAFNAGQKIIAGKPVSRKHLVIEIAPVSEGDATDLQSRAKITLEDQNTKTGTTVNGKSIRGERFDLLEDENEIVLGKSATLRITWHPVVLSFTFSRAEMQKGDPEPAVRAVLEPLDIKFVTKGNFTADVTHVVSKKKNNPRVVEALINCKHVVHHSFFQAIADAAESKIAENTGIETSPLEDDFVANWPDEEHYLPVGAEGAVGVFAPNAARREFFDGYTFIFYQQKDHEDMLPAIAAGKGKALLRQVVPGETDVDDFIRYVKGVAGEKGLGEFEDGSEGKGVAVVRHLPSGENGAWYNNFFNEFALRLDHRPIQLRDFLTAVLEVDAAMLRRPLELELTQRQPATQHQDLTDTSAAADSMAMEIDSQHPSPVIEPSPSPPPARRPRKGHSKAQSRFKGFNIDSDDSDDNAAPANTKGPSAAAESQGMFMTQQSDAVMSRAPTPGASSTLTQRKRPAPEPARELMDSVAPTAAHFKRQRLETGQNPFPVVEKTLSPEPKPPQPAKKGRAVAAKKPARKGKKGADDSGDELLDQLVQTGQAEEANRHAEDDLLRRQLFEGEIDLESIRQATAVQTVAIRRKPAQAAEQQGEERWDPHWNGLKNFKKFRPQTERDAPRVRAPPRKILSLQPVKSKEYGLSDEYWIGTEDTSKTKKGRGSRIQTQNETQRATSQTQGRVSQRGARKPQQPEVFAVSDSEQDEDVFVASPPRGPQARSRRGKAAEKASQQAVTAPQKRTATRTTARSKRSAAVEPLAAEKAAKRSRTGPSRASREATVEEVEEEEDSDEGGGIGFRFGKRK